MIAMCGPYVKMEFRKKRRNPQLVAKNSGLAGGHPRNPASLRRRQL